jgi:hypothetical protein
MFIIATKMRVNAPCPVRRGRQTGLPPKGGLKL